MKRDTIFYNKRRILNTRKYLSSSLPW